MERPQPTTLRFTSSTDVQRLPSSPSTLLLLLLIFLSPGARNPLFPLFPPFPRLDLGNDTSYIYRERERGTLPTSRRANGEPSRADSLTPGERRGGDTGCPYSHPRRPFERSTPFLRSAGAPLQPACLPFPLGKLLSLESRLFLPCDIAGAVFNPRPGKTPRPVLSSRQ